MAARILVIEDHAETARLLVQALSEGPTAFERDEALFRRGFEAALAGDTRGRTWSEALTTLRARHGADLDAPAFRRGWERGQTYFRQTGRGAGLKKSA